VENCRTVGVATKLPHSGFSSIPSNGTINIKSWRNSNGKVASIRLLGSDVKLKWQQTNEGLELDLSGMETGRNGFAIESILYPLTLRCKQ
jgi:hypothetical protein